MRSVLERVLGVTSRTNRSNGRSFVAMESIESRMMRAATIDSSVGDSLSEISGTYYGAVLFGDNGYAYGTPTACAGTSSNAPAYTYTAWDNNLDDGVDSGLVEFGLAINVDGAGAGYFVVRNTAPISFSTGTGGSIEQVTVQADVANSYMEMQWQDVTVSFYSGGQLMETVSLGGLSAGALDGSTSGPAESVVTISTNTSNYDGVYVTGHVRLMAAEGMYPNPTDIFGQVTIS